MISQAVDSICQQARVCWKLLICWPHLGSYFLLYSNLCGSSETEPRLRRSPLNFRFIAPVADIFIYPRFWVLSRHSQKTLCRYALMPLPCSINCFVCVCVC